MPKIKRVILTGFRPFGNYLFNPTEDLIYYYDDLPKSIKSINIFGVVLPCTYFGAFEVLSKMINGIKPDAIISLGLSSSVKGIRIETVFRNLMLGKYADADGCMPVELPICTGLEAREYLASTADNISLANSLHLAKIPVEVSGDADTFICNSLGYLTTKKILDNNLHTRNMFIHIPWTDDYESKILLGPNKIFLEKEELHQAVELLIKNI